MGREATSHVKTHAWVKTHAFFNEHAMSLFLRKHEEVLPSPDLPKIKAVRAYVSRASDYGASDVHDTADTHWIMGQAAPDGTWDHVTTHPPITNPMSIFDKYAGSRKSWGVAKVPTVIVEIEQEDGLIGVGTSTGGEAAAFIIEHHLSMFVEGQNVRNISHMWDQMWRASIHYGRKGLGMHAISAVDIALWDLLGKVLLPPDENKNADICGFCTMQVKGEPVFNLMGGRTKQRIPCYATTSRPDLAKEMGFCGAKVPLPYGPSDGQSGMTANIKFMADWYPSTQHTLLALSMQHILLALSMQHTNQRWTGVRKSGQISI